MITEVKLKNWRSHLNSKLNFSSGTNVLIGHMGSGKTSILDSICFALFGTFPNLQSRKLKLDDLIMNKPIKKDTAEVELSFHLNGKKYSVKRIIEKRKGTTYSELRENGKLIESPSTQRVNELIEKILKVDYELFSKAIYSEQNALDYFLTIPKGQRMKKIDELLMIDKFEKARANTITLSNKIYERKSAKESTIDKINIDEIETTVSNIKSSLENLLAEKVKFEKECEEIIQKRKTLEEKLNNLYKIRETYERLKREEMGISSAIHEVSNRLQSLEQSLKDVKKDSLKENFSSISNLLDSLTNSLEEKRKEQEKLMNQYSKLKAETEFYKKEIEKLNSEIEEKIKYQKEAEKLKKRIGEDADKELDKKKKLIEEYVGKLEAIKIKINDLIDVIDQLSSIKARCPICESKLTEERKIVLIKQKQNQIDNLKEDFKRIAEQKKITEDELKDLELSINKLKELLAYIKDLENLKNNLENTKNIFNILVENTSTCENELKKIKTIIEKLQANINEAQSSKNRLESFLKDLKDYEISKARIEELEKERKAILSHLNEIEKVFSDENLKNLENDLRNIIGKEKELSAKINAINNLVTERENRLKELESTLSAAKKEKEEIKKLDDVLIQLNLFAKALEITQVQLRQEFITTVNYSMNHLWQALYPYKDFPEIRLNVEEGDYILQLRTQNNEWINVEGIVSGGERSLAVLTLRIAFSLVLAPHLRILFLDEPTMNLDQKAIDVLATALRERIHEFIDQCFLITHEERLQDAVTGIAYKLERNKTNDEYTKIIQLN